MTSGFKYRERAALGYVQVTSKEVDKTLRRFDIDVSKDTLLLFQEDSSKPVASISMTDLPTNTILEVNSCFYEKLGIKGQVLFIFDDFTQKLIPPPP